MPVEIKGLAETLKAMRQFEPDLAKNLNREVRTALTPIIKEARGFVPSQPHGLSNWVFSSGKLNKTNSVFTQTKHFPKFNSSIVKRNMKIFIGASKRNPQGFIALYRLSNLSAAGAIMETAGRTHPAGQPWNPKSASHDYSHSRNPGAGQHFNISMGGRLTGSGKTRGRLLYRAWDENNGKVFLQVNQAVNKTVIEFSRRAKAHGVYKVAA